MAWFFNGAGVFAGVAGCFASFDQGCFLFWQAHIRFVNFFLCVCVFSFRVQTPAALATAILGHCVAMFVLAWVLNNGAGVFDGAVFLIFFFF